MEFLEDYTSGRNPNSDDGSSILITRQTMTSLASSHDQDAQSVEYPRRLVPNQISIQKSRGRGHQLYSSFRQKSHVSAASAASATAEKRPRRQWSTGTPPPDPPKLRDLIHNSGIWNEVRESTMNNMQSIMEHDSSDQLYPSNTRSQDHQVAATLHSTINELLTMDEQEPIPCTCDTSKSSCLYHSNLSSTRTTRPKITISFYSSSEETTSKGPQSSEGTLSEVSLPSDMAPLHALPASFEPEDTDSALPPSTPTIQKKSMEEPSRSSLFQPPPRLPSLPHAVPPRPSSRFIPSALQTPPLQRGKGGQHRRSESDELRNSDHIIGGMDMMKMHASNRSEMSSIVSELTFASSFRRSTFMTPPTTPMVMDPRAPQMQMAMEQDLPTRHTRNILTGANPPPLNSPAPPMRKTSIPIANPAQPVRKASPEEEELPRPAGNGDPMPPPKPYSRRTTSAALLDQQNSSIPATEEIEAPMPALKAYSSLTPTTVLPDHRNSSIPSESEMQYSEDESSAAKSMESSLVGPFASPSLAGASPHTKLPSDAPLQTSNPQLYPRNLEDEDSVSLASAPTEEEMPKSLRGPFVSPSVVDTARPSLQDLLTPKENSNPLLYPTNLLSDDDDEYDTGGNSNNNSHGEFSYPDCVITYIPPSPLQKEVKKAVSKGDILFDMRKELKAVTQRKNKKTPTQRYSDIVLDHGLVPQNTPNEKVSLDLAQSTVEDIVFDGASTKVQPKKAEEKPASIVPSKIQSRIIADRGVEEAFLSNVAGGGAVGTGSSSSATTSRMNGLRVKMCPAELGYRMNGENHLHPGYYSGPLNDKFQMHGNGMFWFSSGDVYLGGFSNGELNGVGTMSITTNGKEKQVFTGHFHRNAFVGEK